MAQENKISKEYKETKDKLKKLVTRSAFKIGRCFL